MPTKYIPRFSFMAISLIALLLLQNNVLSANTGRGNYYQLKIYHLKSPQQVLRMDKFLEKAYLPALHRYGIKQVGVFKPIKKDSSSYLLYLLIPYTSFDQIQQITSKLSTDSPYLKDGTDVLNAPYNDAPYTRIETILLGAFPKMPTPAVPNLSAPKTDRVYELRSYESPTEKYNENKVKMFNVGDEVAIFKRLGFNAIFYAEVLSGSHMPNLMYLTCFNNMADREKHWDLFGKDPKWNSLQAEPQYQHNVSKADILFLHPTSYSDF